MIGCPACAKTIPRDSVTCPKCGVQVVGHVPAAVQDEFALMATMTDPQRLLFQQQLAAVRKDSTTAVLLSVFLGGLGVHQFYMGNTLMGVLYLVFCWTFVPAILGLIEAFTMPGRVRHYNAEQAARIAAQMQAFAAITPTNQGPPREAS